MNRSGSVEANTKTDTKDVYDNENQQNTNSKSYLFGRSYLSYAYTPNGRIVM